MWNLRGSKDQTLFLWNFRESRDQTYPPTPISELTLLCAFLNDQQEFILTKFTLKFTCALSFSFFYIANYVKTLSQRFDRPTSILYLVAVFKIVEMSSSVLEYKRQAIQSTVL